MIQINEFTTQQKIAIAEYIYADMTDTLIKSEGEAVIKAMQEHHIPEAFVTNLETNDIEALILNNTTNETRTEIFNAYVSGKL